MANSTKLINLKYANIGDVTIKFDDGTPVMHNINQIDSGNSHSPTVGTYFDKDSTRNPVSISVFEDTWDITDLPAQITYPDGQSGTITDVIYIQGHEIFLDEVG